MGLTRFPHGIFATPLIGGDMDTLMQLWASDQIYFVDGDNGQTGNDGLSPDNALTLPSAAVNKASAGATIYVRPRATAAGAQTYYVDNIDITLDLNNLSIIGAGGVHPSAQSGVQIKPSVATDHLIDILAPAVTIKNLRLTYTGGSAGTAGNIINADNVLDGSRRAHGLQVYGCSIENDKNYPSFGSTTSLGAVCIGSVNDCIIANNRFTNCIAGILVGTTAGNQHSVLIAYNQFNGAPASRDVDVALNLGASYGMNIMYNIFPDGLPAHASGVIKRFIKIVGATATGIVGGNYFGTTTDSFTAAGSECIIPNTFWNAGNLFNNGFTTGA